MLFRSEIKDFDGDAIQDLVGFAYSSRLTLTVDNVQPLLYAACILQVLLLLLDSKIGYGTENTPSLIALGSWV